MALVTKYVKGIPYLYLQDSVKVGKKNKVITTYIGRADLAQDELQEAKAMAFMSHTGTLAGYYEPKTYKSNFISDEDQKGLANVQIIYAGMKTLLQSSEWDEAERNFYVRHVYGTTAIEGITLSESETAKVLEQDLTPQNKPVQDVIAVANYRNIRDMLKGYRGPINERLIKNIHSTLMYGMKNERGEAILRGVYREKNVFLTGLSYSPPSWEAVPQMMRYILQEYEQGLRENTHPVELAAIFHQKFEEIHPFQDGNGRTGREILNLMLTRADLPSIYIKPEERSAYIAALEDGNRGEHESLVGFVTNRIVATLYYLMARTSVYNLLTANGVIEHAKREGIGGYMKMMKRLQKYKDADGPP